MRHIHKINDFLQFCGNLLMVVLLMGLISLPAASVGIINIARNSNGETGEVLSGQDIRIKIDPEEINTGKYFYNERTGKIELKSSIPSSYHKSVIEELREITEDNEILEDTETTNDPEIEDEEEITTAPELDTQ